MKLAPLVLLIAACANADAAWETPGLRFQDEGVHKGYATAVNCAGAGITCAVAGGKATLTVPGGGGTGTPGGVSGNIQTNDGLGAFGAYPGLSCPASTYLTDLDSSGNGTCAQVTTGQLSGTITDAQLANNYSGVGACAANQYANTLNDNAGPTCSQVAYSQVSGTPTLFNQTIQEEGVSVTQRATVNVIGPAITAADDAVNGKTKLTVVASGTGTCTNQFVTATNDGAAPTCTTDTLASAQHANQGTTTTLLHGNAAGNPSWTGVSLTADTSANQGTTTTVLHGNAAGQPSFAAVSLTADVSGIVPLANGGTNANLTADNGAIPYSSASAFALLAHGTAGQALFSGGAAAPTWGSVWQFLGTATAAATTVGPITWTATTRYVMCSYQIINYNGGTPVGRFLMGTASISTTARTNSYAISEGVTAPTTASGGTATPGIPLAVTLSNVGRMGSIFIDGQSGSVKTINVLGQNQTPAVATVPTIFQGASFFSDLGTNLAITRAQLTVYDTLTATAASSQTFTSGTRLTCWGRDIS